MLKKIKYLLLLSFVILLTLCTKSQARITTNDPTVSSEGTVTITINSQEEVAYGAIDIISNEGLTFISASGGEANGTFLAFSGSTNKTTGIATYTFKAPKVTETKTFKVVFQSKDMGNKDDEEVASTQATATVTVEAPKNTSSNGGGGSSSGSSSSSGSNSNSSSQNNTTTPEPSFTSVNETVYAKSEVNIRKSWSTSSTILGSLQEGESITRTGKSSTWSRVTYNGTTAYISSDYLTTEKPEEKEEEKSTNKNLKSLTISTGEISPEFNKDVTKYTATIKEDITKVTVNAIPEDEKAKIEVTGNDNLQEGTNIIKIKVTAEDETVRTYSITVTKKIAETEVEQKLGLSSLSIEGVTLTPKFSLDVYEYTVEFSSADITKANVTAVANNENATVEIIGHKELKQGENIITILLKLEGTEEQEEQIVTYQIKATVPTAEELAKTNDNMKLYLVAGAVGIIILIIIIFIISKRKNGKEETVETYYNTYSSKDTEKEHDVSNSERKEDVSVSSETIVTDKQENTEKKYNLDEFMKNDEPRAKRKGKHF